MRLLHFSIFLLTTTATGLAQGQPRSCIDCHDETLAGSVHAELDCTLCHAGITLENGGPDVGNPHGSTG